MYGTTQIMFYLLAIHQIVLLE